MNSKELSSISAQIPTSSGTRLIEFKRTARLQNKRRGRQRGGVSDRATHTQHQQESDPSLSWPPKPRQRGRITVAISRSSETNICREHPIPKKFRLTAVRPCLSTAWPRAQTCNNNNNNHLGRTASRPCMQHREARGRAPPDPKRVQAHNRTSMPKHRMAQSPNMQ